MSVDVRTEIQADLQALCRALSSGEAVDPAVSFRVKERSQKLRDELARRFGKREIAVELLREVRDE